MSLLDEVRKVEQSVVKRLKELEPQLREYDQLRKLAERLGIKYTPAPTDESVAAQGSKPAAARARTGRGRAAKTAAKPRGPRSTTTRKKAAAKGTRASAKATPTRATSSKRSSGRGATRPGQRTEEVLALVRANPGITVREIGQRLGVDATGLYRVANRLTGDGSVRKDGTRLYPAATGGAAVGESGAVAAGESVRGPGDQAARPASAKQTASTDGTQ